MNNIAAIFRGDHTASQVVPNFVPTEINLAETFDPQSVFATNRFVCPANMNGLYAVFDGGCATAADKISIKLEIQRLRSGVWERMGATHCITSNAATTTTGVVQLQTGDEYRLVYTGQGGTLQNNRTFFSGYVLTNVHAFRLGLQSPFDFSIDFIGWDRVDIDTDNGYDAVDDRYVVPAGISSRHWTLFLGIDFQVQEGTFVTLEKSSKQLCRMGTNTISPFDAFEVVAISRAAELCLPGDQIYAQIGPFDGIVKDSQATFLSGWANK